MRKIIDVNLQETLNTLWTRLQIEGFDIDHMHAVTTEADDTQTVNHLRWDNDPEMYGVWANWNGVEYVGNKTVAELGFSSLVADEWHEQGQNVVE